MRATRGFRARIRLLDAAEGGRGRPAVSGYGPQLQLGSISTSVLIIKMDGDQVASDEELVPGDSYDVFVVVPFADQYAHAPDPADIRLLEGSRVIAVGEAVGPVYDTVPDSVLGRIR